MARRSNFQADEPCDRSGFFFFQFGGQSSLLLTTCSNSWTNLVQFKQSKVGFDPFIHKQKRIHLRFLPTYTMKEIRLIAIRVSIFKAPDFCSSNLQKQFQVLEVCQKVDRLLESHLILLCKGNHFRYWINQIFLFIYLFEKTVKETIEQRYKKYVPRKPKERNHIEQAFQRKHFKIIKWISPSALREKE